MYMLIPNDQHRYAVQSSDASLKYNDDGSLDIYTGPTPPTTNASTAVTPDGTVHVPVVVNRSTM